MTKVKLGSEISTDLPSGYFKDFVSKIESKRLTYDFIYQVMLDLYRPFITNKWYFENEMKSYLENYYGRGNARSIIPKDSELSDLLQIHGGDYVSYAASDGLATLNSFSGSPRDFCFRMRGMISLDIERKKYGTNEYVMEEVKPCLFTIEVVRMINCCGAAAISGLSHASEIGSSGSLATILAEILAYLLGYRLGIITTYDRDRSNKILIEKLNWENNTVWRNYRTSTDLIMLSKPLVIEDSLRNLENLFKHVTSGDAK